MAVNYRKVRFGGVEITCKEISMSVGSQTAHYTYPDIGETFLQNLSESPRKFSINGFISGNDVITKRERLERLAIENTPNLLIFGSIGRFRVQTIGQITISESFEKLGFYDVSFNASVTVDSALPRRGLVNALNNIRNSINDFFSPLRAATDGLDDALDTAREVNGFVDDMADVSGVFYYQNQLRGFQKDILQSISNVGDNVASLRSLVISEEDRPPPANAIEYMGLLNRVFDEIDNNEDLRTEIYEELVDEDFQKYDDIKFNESTGEEIVIRRVKIPPSSLNTLSVYNAGVRLAENFRQIFFLKYLESVLQIDFIVQSEIKNVIAYIQETYLSFENPSIRLHDAYVSALNDLTNKSINSLVIKQIETGEYVSYSQISRSLYSEEQDERAKQIYALNRDNCLFGNRGKFFVLDRV